METTQNRQAASLLLVALSIVLKEQPCRARLSSIQSIRQDRRLLHHLRTCFNREVPAQSQNDTMLNRLKLWLFFTSTGFNPREYWAEFRGFYDDSEMLGNEFRIAYDTWLTDHPQLNSLTRAITMFIRSPQLFSYETASYCLHFIREDAIDRFCGICTDLLVKSCDHVEITPDYVLLRMHPASQQVTLSMPSSITKQPTTS